MPRASCGGINSPHHWCWPGFSGSGCSLVVDIVEGLELVSGLIIESGDVERLPIRNEPVTLGLHWLLGAGSKKRC